MNTRNVYTAEFSGGRDPIPQWRCVVALKSLGALLGVLADKHGVHNWVALEQPRRVLRRQCGEGGHGWRVWSLMHESQSIGFLLKVLEPFLRSFQTVRDSVLV